MEIELQLSLLTDGAMNELALLALCAFGYSGRHRITTDSRVEWEEWVSTLPKSLADEVRLAWDEGEQLRAIGAPSEGLCVVPRGPAIYGQTTIVAPPPEALGLLGRPLRVVLENGRNDRDFVLAFADKASRKTIVRAEQEGWVVFETAGGIGELAVRVEAAVESAPSDVLRTMYLCDSDAREPGAPSDTSTKIEEKLGRLCVKYRRLPGHFGGVLERRAAENYAPPGKVLSWSLSAFGPEGWMLCRDATDRTKRASLARSPGVAGSLRNRLLAAIAFKELDERERAHLDMKHGRARVSQGKPNIRTVDAIWNALDDFQKAALEHGFGDGFSADFYGTQRELDDRSGEVAAFLAIVIRRL